MATLLALSREDYPTMAAELAAITLPHGNMIYVPGPFARKLIIRRCADHRDLHSSRRLQEPALARLAMPQEAARREIEDSIRWWWLLPIRKRAELEARYQGLN